MIKKGLFIVLTALGLFEGAKAQDIIYTTDGQTIEVRNIKFEGNTVRYGLYSASIMDRTTYTIDKNRVRQIKYETGYTYDPNEQPTSNVRHTKKEENKETAKTDNKPDTVIVYATLSPNKQLNPKLFNAYPKYKNPAIAFGASLILPGLGQLYNDELKRGFLFMAAEIVPIGFLIKSYSNSSVDASSDKITALILHACISLGSGIEAAISANNKNKVNGYVTFVPTLEKVYLADNGGRSAISPSVALNFKF